MESAWGGPHVFEGAPDDGGVQSSWFPLYDRNPQTYVENIMTAPASAYKAETVSVFGSAKYPSHLICRGGRGGVAVGLKDPDK